MIIRRAVGAGRWFPGNADELKADIEEYMSASDLPDFQGRIVAAIAPHAGYLYSGKVAGRTFGAIKDNATAVKEPDVTVVLGFSHSYGFSGVALMDGDAIATPLGQVELDRESGDFLDQFSRRIFYAYDPHEGEHSAENEIPFLQIALPSTKLVVGLMGDHEEETLGDLVSALVELAERKSVLVVASTDLLHHEDYELVSRTDAGTLKLISLLDDDALITEWSPRHQICCGIMPVVAAIRFAKAMGASEGKVLEYSNSGDDFPESRGSWVVGYGSVVFSAG